MKQTQPDLFSQASHHEVGPAAGWPVHQSVEESREIVKTVLSQPETYALVLKETGQVIGSIGLMVGKQSGLDLPDSEAELGYWLGQGFWGQGLVPEACQAILNYGFNQLDLEKSGVVLLQAIPSLFVSKKSWVLFTNTYWKMSISHSLMRSVPNA